MRRRCPSCRLLHGSGEPLCFYVKKCKSYMEKHLKCRGWKRSLCYEQTCNISQQQHCMLVIKTPDVGQGSLLYETGRMQKTGHMELVPDAPRDEEVVERKTEGDWELTGDVDFTQLLNDTKFQGYTSRPPKAMTAAQLSASL